MGNTEREGLQLYDLKHRRLVSSKPSEIELGIHHIQYNPNGQLIVAVCVNISIYISCTVSLHSIQIFDSQTFDTIHIFPHDRAFSKIELIKMFPMFSRNGDILTQICGEPRSPPLVKLYQMPNKDRCLQESCRSIILRCTPRRYVNILPLPNSMIKFLQHSDSNS